MDNYRAGIIATAVINALSKSKVKPLDFFKQRAKAKSSEELLAKVEMLNMMLGGRDLRGMNEPSSS